jgi:hypothetical protein
MEVKDTGSVTPLLLHRLNEGFVEWMQALGLNHVFPEFQSFDVFVTGNPNNLTNQDYRDLRVSPLVRRYRDTLK